MSAATITPLPGGKALFVWRGIEHVFADVFEAQREARARGIPVADCPVTPFAATPVTVIATSPALAAP
ncbi:hypothetical protein AB0F72_09475 [Actinoplanes sp. NPDC023936]|uniref:hypothetical protein n=1 Tax=Actinoplanes sp. NPDC023936 TaxID=3154910 RepID=UPI0033CA89B3